MTPTRRRSPRIAVICTAAGLAAGLLGACSSPGSPTPSTPAGSSPVGASPSATTTSGPPAAPVEVARPPSVADVAVLARGLEVPWGVAMRPDGSALVGQRRTGEVLLVAPDGASRSVGRVPGVADRGEGGLLGLAVAPDDPATLIAYLTTDDDNRVVALPFDGSRLGEPRVLLDGIPAGSIHNGGRIAVGPDGDLYIGTGDAGERNRSQSPGDLGGKILRITTDGSVPADNPEPGSPVWSRGHRNVQGLAFDSAGRLWATEFGQNRLDELNLIEPGRNYGWPVVEGRGGATVSSTRRLSGRPTRPRRAGSPSSTTSPCWPACAASASGWSR